MELHILLAGVEFGPYTDNQVRELLGEGFLSETDPAKRLDETDWLPLSEVLAQSRAGSAMDEPVAKGPVEEEASAEEEPAAKTPAFEWPAPEEHEEFGTTPETAPASSVEEEVEPSEPGNEPPIEASSTFSETTDEPGSSTAAEKSAPIEMPPAKQEEEPARVESPTAAFRSRPTPRQLTAAEKTAFLLPLTAPLPAITQPRAAASASTPSGPAPMPAPTPAPVRPVPASSPTSAPVAPAATPIVSATPLLQVSLPSKARKAMRTGSLLAQDALRAARDQQGILSPGGAPAPEAAASPRLTVSQSAEKAAPAPRRKPQLVLRGREETPTLPPAHPPEPVPPVSTAPPLASTSAASAPTTPLPPSNPATTQRKAIRLTGRITLPGLAPKPELTQNQSPTLSGPLVISRPGRTGAVPARTTTRPLTAREKSSFLTGEIARPADVAKAETAAEEKKITEVPAPSGMEESQPVHALMRAAGEETVADEPIATEPAPGSITALLRAAGTDTVAEPSASGALPALPVIEEPSSEPDLTASGRLASTTDLAERRSLKITGPLRQPAPRAPIRLSSPSKPGESSRPPYSTGERPPTSGLPTVEIPPQPQPPAPEESLPPRPQSGKIPVSAMPTEGIRIRTRRVTGKVAVPEKESTSEPLSARATPPPPLPAPQAEPSPAAGSKIISITPPRAEPALVVPLPIEPRTTEPVAPATLPESSAVLPEPAMDAAAAVPAEAPDLAKPDKIRLRRPVKLELSSRAKIQESGRLTLEAFSKMASLDLPGKTAPISPAPAAETPPPAAKETPAGPAEPISPPGPTAPSSPATYPQPRLEEAPPLVWKSSLPKSGRFWEWAAYGVITVGVIALCAIVYLIVHRSSGRAAPAEVATTTTTETSASETSNPPASAEPPASNPTPTPGESAPSPAPTTPVTPQAPASAQPPASNSAPSASAVTASIQDLNRQVEAYVGDGILKYQHGDLAGALAADNQALDLNSKSAPALFNRGLVKAAQNDLDGAVADYSAALQIDPNMAAAYYYRGLARHSKAELDGALSDYNQALQIDPRNPQAFFNRGMIRMQKDDIDGVIVDSTRALELDPHFIPSYYNRGLGRLAKGSMDGALSDMKAYCQLAPQDAFTDYARLYIWLIESQQGQLAEANQELSKAMNSGWNGAATSMVTRIGEFLLGQISENELLKAASSDIPVKDQGRHCEAWYFIGMRRLQAGDKQAAVDDLRKCVDTQKTDYCEYILAQEELKNLSPGGATDGAPPAPRAQAVSLPDPGTMAPNGTPDPATGEK